MKILLYGEFSGLHTNLKAGLEKLGHKVTLLSFGDDFKDIPGDINIKIRKFKNKYLNFFYFQLISFWLLRKLKGYDIVQLIAISQLVLPFGKLGYYFVKILKKRNKKVFLNSCGDDIFVILTFIKQAYSPFQNEIKDNLNWRLFHFCKKSNYAISKKMVGFLSGIIASNSTYHLSYQSFKNYRGLIPMPVILPGKFGDNVVNGKIKIFFGIGSRRSLKGVDYILKALDTIKDKFSNEIEVTVVEKVPYQTYQNLFNSCNIFIDQACSYSYGMNALLGLTKGKVVLSGNEPIVGELLGEACPVINIKPDSRDIARKLEKLIKNPATIPVIGRKSYEFTAKFHDHIIVAQKYLSSWNA